MRIGLDAHHLNGKPQGSRTYLLHLIQHLSRLAGNESIYVYSFDPKATDGLLAAANVTHRRLFPSFPHFRIPLVVPALEMRDRLDVFHSQYVCPLISPAYEIVSIHDILFETHPELFRGAFSRASAWLIRQSARRARFVVTGSEFSRRMLIELYRLPEEKVVVTPDGVDTLRFRPLEPHQDLESVRARYRLEGPFVLSVGRLEPRKNLERLVRAFWSAHQKLDGQIRLVIAGFPDFGYQGIYREVEKGPAGAVRILGAVPDEDLPALYQLASVFAYPSLIEGFGLPVLEAMACGTPVVTSGRGALAEVANQAALSVEPEDEGSIAAALVSVLSDRELRARLRRQGLERVKPFRWEETARKTIDVYRRCAER